MADFVSGIQFNRVCDELVSQRAELEHALAVCTELAEAAERDRLSEMEMADRFYAAATQRDEALALVRELRDVLDSLNSLDPTYGDVDVVLARARALLGEVTE